jgi:hypothetical protein
MYDTGRSIRCFINHDEKHVLILKGKWEVGKTHYWNSIVEGKTLDLCKKLYSYVSLFGVSNLKDLQSSIFSNSLNLSSADLGTDASLSIKS